MNNPRIIFCVHAVQRMFERQISEQNVRQVLRSGELIEDYSDDMPFPSGLMLGKRGTRPLHVVMAENTNDNEFVVITAYEPAASQWKSNFKSRK